MGTNMSNGLIRQKWIVRRDLHAYPNRLYAFGDNMARLGYGGQAREMRGEPNAVGIPTKWAPTTNEKAYFTDDILVPPIPYITTEQMLKFHPNQRVIDSIDKGFAKLRDYLAAGGEVVIPTDGLGTGLSELPTRAPRIHAYIEAWIRGLEEVL